MRVFKHIVFEKCGYIERRALNLSSLNKTNVILLCIWYPCHKEGIPTYFVEIIKQGNKYWKSNSIGSIINQFKRICTIKVKSCGLDLSWQPRFYDHIIRSDNEIDRIRTYIKNNPNNWLNDV